MACVVSVDTSIAHLSGALGIPTWVMLPFMPDWRWQLDRTDSPWYPGMKLYRQPDWDDWGRVFDAVGTDLAQHLSPA
jgi:ADP-heptose:LPS heptosyltransferase